MQTQQSLRHQLRDMVNHGLTLIGQQRQTLHIIDQLVVAPPDAITNPPKKNNGKKNR